MSLNITAAAATQNDSAEKRRPWLWLATAVWLLAAAAGLAVLWKYDNEPGAGANAQARWPTASVLARTPGQPALVFLAHPQCSCTPASLAELAEVLARARHAPQGIRPLPQA